MSDVQGKNSLSYKKKSVQESKIPTVGVKTIAFAHEFTNAGESFLPFNSLNLPADWASSGLTNPSGASLLASQLQLFKRNISVISSARGAIQKSEYVVSNSGITFKNIVSLENEIFEVTVGDVLVIGTTLLDMRKIRVEGELADTTTDFAFGYQVDVFDEEIVVVRDGVIQHRSDDNDSSGTTGNYYYLDSDNDGKASSIRFFDAAIGDEGILIFSTGGIVDSPNISTFQQIETLAGQLDNIIPTVAALAGVPESDFRAAANYVDLKNFGSLVNSLLNAEVPIKTSWQQYTPNITHNSGSMTNYTLNISYKRDGSMLDVEGEIIFTGASAAFNGIYLSLPNSVLLDQNIKKGAADGGQANLLNAGLAVFKGIARTTTDSRILLQWHATNTADAGSSQDPLVYENITQSVPFALGNDDSIKFSFRAPIQGWQETQTLRQQLGL